MRKVLLRFVFDNLWQWQSVGNELHVGAAWLILVWTVGAGLAFWLLYRRSRNASESLMSIAFWLIVPVLFGFLGFVKPDIAIVTSGIPVFGYGLMMFVGFSVATWTATRRVRSIGQPPETIWDMMMWALVPGLIGARAVYLAQNWVEVTQGRRGMDLFVSLISLWDGGIVFFGSVFGGIAGVLLYCRRRKIVPIQMLDVIAPSMFIGEGFGRIGCFLYGCCFGQACDLPWAVRFPPDSLTFTKLVERGTITPDAASTIALHPTQLYSSVSAFLLAGLLAWWYRRKPFDGAVFSLALILYPIIRFVIETLRDDEPGRLGTGMTFSQLVSIGMVLAGIGSMVWFSRRKKSDTVTSRSRAS